MYKHKHKRQILEDIEFLKHRQKELMENTTPCSPNVKKRRTKRTKRTKRCMKNTTPVVNIIKLPGTENKQSEISSQRHFHCTENKDTYEIQKYLEKQRIHNKERLLKIKPPPLSISSVAATSSSTKEKKIKIRIKTPTKIRRKSPRKHCIPSNHLTMYHKSRLVSPMFYRKYSTNSNASVKQSTNKKEQEHKRIRTRKIVLPSVNQLIKNQRIDYQSFKKILHQLDRKNIIHLLVKENMVRWNTKAPKDVLIDLFLTIQLHQIHLIR